MSEDALRDYAKDLSEQIADDGSIGYEYKRVLSEFINEFHPDKKEIAQVKDLAAQLSADWRHNFE